MASKGGLDKTEEAFPASNAETDTLTAEEVRSLVACVKQQRIQMLRQEEIINELREEIARRDGGSCSRLTNASGENTVSIHPRHRALVKDHAGKRGRGLSERHDVSGLSFKRPMTSTPIRRSSSQPAQLEQVDFEASAFNVNRTHPDVGGNQGKLGCAEMCTTKVECTNL
jgi:hypothetical protein